MSGLDGFGMRRIGGFARSDVYAHVGQGGFDAWRREENLGVTGAETDVAATEVPSSSPSTFVYSAGSTGCDRGSSMAFIAALARWPRRALT
jgi:hypothetical protein